MPTSGLSIKPLKDKLAAGEQEATEFWLYHRLVDSISTKALPRFPLKTGRHYLAGGDPVR